MYILLEAIPLKLYIEPAGSEIQAVRSVVELEWVLEQQGDSYVNLTNVGVLIASSARCVLVGDAIAGSVRGSELVVDVDVRGGICGLDRGLCLKRFVLVLCPFRAGVC